MTKPELIYIATRLTAEHPIKYLENLQESIDAAVIVYRKGHFPVIPGLDFMLYMNLKGDYGFGERVPYSMSLRILEGCDSILLHNGINDSPGVQKELLHALKNKIKVYRHLDDIHSVENTEIRLPEGGEQVDDYVAFIRSHNPDYPYITIFNEKRLAIYEEKYDW